MNDTPTPSFLKKARFLTCLATLLLLSVVWSVFDDSANGNSGPESIVGSDQQRRSQPSQTNRHSSGPSDLKQAGVCARCHVVSALEWGISGHVESETHCQKCHGPSRGHVANERNEIKPDRLPHGQAIAKQLCLTCHETGCPNTLQVGTCQKCHHVHALIDPTKPPQGRDDRLAKLLQRWEQFRQQMREGEQHVKRRDWSSAEVAFRQALTLVPSNHRARTRLNMCRRRRDPILPGFKIVADEFDSETGLPREVQVVTNSMPMILVPPGEFDMGSDEITDSRPVHTVRISAFYLGRYEVTQAEWKAVMGVNPSTHQGTGFSDSKQMPVECVSWNDCQEFIRRLNRRVPGSGFRLPTEAEWECACRAGRQETRLVSKDRVPEHSWFRGNSLRQSKSETPFRQVDAYAPRPVGTRHPNGWGFYDMQGNVCEWCSSLRRPYVYKATDGRESLKENGMRVLRGGGFADAAAELDPALRHTDRPHRRLRFNGLRVARSVPITGD